jgi:hypothetical protein
MKAEMTMRLSCDILLRKVKRWFLQEFVYLEFFSWWYRCPLQSDTRRANGKVERFTIPSLSLSRNTERKRGSMKLGLYTLAPLRSILKLWLDIKWSLIVSQSRCPHQHCAPLTKAPTKDCSTAFLMESFHPVVADRKTLFVCREIVPAF